ncbi:MAG TPA: type II secretion system protein GspG [Planctomycetota bacterium]
MGFAPVGVLVLACVLGLATLLLGGRVSSGTEAREAKVRADVLSIAEAVRLYRMRNGKLPASLDALTTKVERGCSELEELPKDSWDHDYILRRGNEAGEFAVISTGPDGSEKTADDISSEPKRDR